MPTDTVFPCHRTDMIRDSAKKDRDVRCQPRGGKIFHAKLYSPEGRQGLEYFYSRGLTDDTIRHFGLGYAPDSKDELIEYLISKDIANSFCMMQIF